VKRTLHVLVAESERAAALRGLVAPHRRIRHAATEQECLDLACAGAGDVMIINLDDTVFRDPELPSRIRFLARNAFPVLGVGTRGRVDSEAWIRGGLAEVLYRDELDEARLDRALCHWARHRRMQRRLHAADRRALQWWQDLVAALDEVRGRLERSSDALDAFLTLLDDGGASAAAQRQPHVLQARKQLAELNQIAADLDIAARTIQLKGLERRQRRAQRVEPDAQPWLGKPWDQEDERKPGAPADGEPEHGRRFGA
jgi:hypothetical protein